MEEHNVFEKPADEVSRDKKVPSFVSKVNFKQLVPLFLVLLVVAGLYYYRSEFVVATVNGKPITRHQMLTEFEKNGADQVLDSIVIQTLIKQKVKEEGIEISNEDIAAEIKNIKELVESQGLEFNQALEMQGLTMEELISQVMLQKQLEKLIEKEIEKNIGEFKNEFQKTSEEIIKSYKSQFESGNQEIQRVLSEFSQQITKETSNLSKFTLDTQNKISEEAKNKILELNQAAEKEFIKIQETNLKVSTQISQSIRETLTKKVQETEKEIDNYKKERFEEIDRKIYQMLGEVAKKTLGKAIDLSTHEKLVIEALEKAKKEIF